MFLRFLTLVLLGLSVAAQPQMQPSRGSICGSFQDENGEPAVDTWIIADDMGAHSGPMFGGKTDAQGHYCVQDLALGVYRVSAEDEGKGYPDINNLFFARHAKQTDVTLTPAVPNVHLDARIPYKAGFLSVLLFDSESGKPLTLMSYSLALRVDPDHSYIHGGTSSDRVLLLPPNEDVYLNVSSPGYDKWPADGTRGVLLNLLPGEKHTVKVRLRKLP